MAETTAFGNGGRKEAAFGLLGVILLVAGLLRVWGASGDLWMDEVWSLENIALSRTRPTAGNWLALFFHANTHPLNTLYLAFLGPDAGVFAYRALSVVSGIAAVAMAAVLGWRRSATEGLIAAAMVAVSYPMVHYAGEARGYSTLLLAALAAVHVMETYLEAPSPGRVLAFIAVSLLGFASHLTFAVIEAGLGVWATVALYPRLRSPVSVLARLTVLFGIQAVVLTAYGAVAWNNFVGFGGTSPSTAVSLNSMAELAFGADPSARGSVAPVLALALAGAVWWLYRRGDGSWIFFAFAVLVYPLGLVLADPPLSTAPRYFIAHALVALIVVARFLSAMMAGKRWARIAAGVALALFFIGNGLLLDKFFAAGRGNYVGVLQTIAEAAAGTAEKGPARVSGYRELLVGEVLRYYVRKQGLSGAITFVPIAEDERDPAPWFIDGGFSDGFTARRPEPVISRPDGEGGTAPYRLLAVFPHWGLSGDSLALYRRAD